MIKNKMINIRLVEDDEVDVMNVKRAVKKNNSTNPLYLATNVLEALIMLRSEDDLKKVPRARLVDFARFKYARNEWNLIFKRITCRGITKTYSRSCINYIK